jgi:hypothetical protein
MEYADARSLKHIDYREIPDSKRDEEDSLFALLFKWVGITFCFGGCDLSAQYSGVSAHF